MINYLGLLAAILLAVAFITLLERKLLSYVQTRKGPNLVGMLGILQPFSDGLKLLTKEEPLWGGSYYIILPPLVFWASTLLFWFSLSEGSSNMGLSIFWLLVLSSVGGMTTFLTGWNGGSVYSVMGGLRASAQMISYEVVLSFLFLMFLFLGGSYSISDLELGGSTVSASLSALFLILPLWITSTLAETNRAPFDLTEGESELVSGFNTEYSSLSFTLLFLGEYGMIIGFSFLSSLFFMNSWAGGLFFASVIMWIRACFPRKRYDFLMNLMWLYFFPLVILALVISINWISS